jgi:hypothetical protein
MFLKNKYHTWYYSIIDKARKENRKKLSPHDSDFMYYEKHHVVPVSLGGANDKDNLVLLTGKEHFICHLLLCYMTESHNKYKMINAVNKMTHSKSGNQQRYTSKSYNLIRSLIAKRNSYLFKDKPKSGDQKKKMSESAMGKKHDSKRIEQRVQINKKLWAEGVFDNRPRHSDETKEKIKRKRANQVITAEHKKNISLGLKGRKLSEESKKKISNARKMNPKIWIKNPQTREYSIVDISIAEKYLNDGWVRGKYQKNSTCVKLT